MTTPKGTEFIAKAKDGSIQRFCILPLVNKTHILAGQNLQKAKVDTRLAEAGLASASEIGCELARLSLADWTVTTPDGGETKRPLEGLDEAQQRELLSTTPGVIDYVMFRAKKLSTDAAADNGLGDELGNS